MGRLYIRNYFVVAVAGMFCLLNTNVISAQTTTDLDCFWCVGPGEVGYDAVGWFSLDASVRQSLTVQAKKIAALEARIAALEASSVPNLGTYLRIDETNPQRPTAWFEAVNVMVVNGTGGTDGPTNGLGNLIVGYDEFRPPCTDCPPIQDDKSGSHNLVVGPWHNYSSFGGLVAGARNELKADHATVSGGFGNFAAGSGASVSGGSHNTASERALAK